MRSAERLSQAVSPLAGLLKTSVILLAVAAMGWAAALMVAPEMRPLLALVVLAALAGLWILVVRLNIRRTLALIFILLLLAPATRLAPGLPVIHGDEVVIFSVGALLLAAGMLRRRGRSWWILGLAGASLMLFLPLTLLSITYGHMAFDIPISRGDWFEFVKFSQYILAFFIASQIDLEEGDLRFLSLVLIGVVSVSALVGILQVFNVGPTRQLSLDIIFGAYAQPDVLQSETKMYSMLATRAAGTVGNPNTFGMMVALGLVMAATLIRGRTPRGPAILATYGSLGLLSAALVLSASRTAALAALVAGVYLLWVSLRERRAGSRGSGNSLHIGRLAPAGAAVLLVLALLLAARSQEGIGSAISGRLGRIAEITTRQGIQDSSVQERIDLTKAAFQEVAGSPVFGYGPAEGARWLMAGGTTDNEITFILLRLGVVGLIVYLVFWLSAFRLARSLTRSPDEEARWFGHAVAMVIVLDLVAAVSMDSLDDIGRMTLTCILLGLCAAARARVKAQDAVQQRDGVPSNGVTQLRRLHAR
ncbi:MAG: O-antigen ligase family protein [Chloroflexi bacterium]|nr:O-antigen ligase family protein [Chloroflexota bacterium]